MFSTRSQNPARRATLPFTLLLLVTTAAAGDLPRGDAAKAGFSSEKLRKIDGLLDNLVERQQIAGGAVLIARHGNVVHLATSGWANAEDSARIQDDTIYRIASMTKPVTSVAAMMLVEDGKLRLSDPVSKYIPEFAETVVLVTPTGPAPFQALRTQPAERAITVHDLLTHTSGLTYKFFAPQPVGQIYADAGVSDGLVETPGTVADNVRRLSKCPLLFQPGSEWSYGLNTDVLGRVVEVASGQTLNEFFQERIFQPLGMNDSHFVVPAGKRDRLAAVYAPREDGRVRPVGKEPVTLGLLTYSTTYSTADDSRYHSGGAGLSSTIGDYFRFLQMLLNDGEFDGQRLLKSETVALMTRNQIGEFSVPGPGHGDKFGYGFGILTKDGQAQDPASVGTYSWGGFFNTYFWVDPEKELIGIMMTQMFPSDHVSLRDDVKRLTYEALSD